MDDTVRVVGERRASRMARNHYLQTRLGESGYPARLVGLKGKLMKYNGQLVWPTTYDNGSLSGFVVNVKEILVNSIGKQVGVKHNQLVVHAKHCHVIDPKANEKKDKASDLEDAVVLDKMTDVDQRFTCRF